VLSFENGTFAAYCMAAVLLVVKSHLTAYHQGVCKAVAKKSPNKEDVGLFATTLAPISGADEERVVRIQKNDWENIPYFLFIAFLYLFTSPVPTTAAYLFAAYVVSRYMHSLCYYLALQPFRTLSFIVCTAVQWYLIYHVGGAACARIFH